MTNENEKIEKEVKELRQLVHEIAVTQAEQLVVMKNVISVMETETTNSAEIAVLKNNWKWVYGLVALMAVPLVFLTLDKIL